MRLIRATVFASNILNSQLFWRFSQKFGLAPNAFESFHAISTLIPRLPRQISFIVLGKTPICAASGETLAAIARRPPCMKSQAARSKLVCRALPGASSEGGVSAGVGFSSAGVELLPESEDDLGLSAF